MEVNINKTVKEDGKRRMSYQVLFVPGNDNASVKKFSIRLELLLVFAAVIILLMTAGLTYISVLSGRLENANETILQLDAQLQEIEAENKQIALENEELQEKVVILSDTVNDKEEQAQQQAQSRVPSGFPLKGTASYDESAIELDGQPIANFAVSPGIGVIATANGTVSSIVGNKSVGYIIMVDHGNGYYSVYRNGSKPKVSEGDEVTKATELFVIEAGQELLGYQIIENNQYINPLELMEIYG